MKKLLLSIMAIAFTCPFFAAQRNIEDVINIAKKQYNNITRLRFSNDITDEIKNNIITSGEILKQRYPLRSSGSISNDSIPDKAFYFVNYPDKGYVLISGDDNMPSVLGYSDEGRITAGSVPENLKDVLKGYAAAYEITKLYGTSIEQSEPKSETDTFPKEITPLLENIKWHQISPYNKFCPVFDGIQCPAGCGATAASQIMYYYKYPQKGQAYVKYKIPAKGKYTGSFDIINDSVEIKKDLSQYEIDWHNMLPTYKNGNYTQDQINAAAKLLTNAGYAIHMNYGKTASGNTANETYAGLTKNFNYDSDAEIVYSLFYTKTEWLQIIKNELYNKRPLYTSGKSSNSNMGHAYVMDGYDKNDLIHINWGWNGSANGYYYIYNDSPHISYPDLYTDKLNNYNLAQWIIINLKPDDNIKSSEKESLYGLAGSYIYNTSLKQQDNLYLMLLRLVGSKGPKKRTVYGLLYKNNTVTDTLFSSGISEIYNNFNKSISTETRYIAPGTYTLKFAHKSDNFLDTIIFNKSYIHSYTLKATKDSLFINPIEKEKSFKLISADTTLKTHNKSYNRFKINIANNSKNPEFAFITIYLESAKRSSSNPATPDTTIQLMQENIYLQENDTTKLSFYTYVNAIPGDYYLSVKYIDYNNNYIEMQKADTIKIKVGKQEEKRYDLIVSKAVFDTSITKNPGDSISAKFTIINKGDFFNGYINMLFTDYPKEDTALSYRECPIQIYSGDSIDFNYSYPMRNDCGTYNTQKLLSGDYKVNLCYYVKLNLSDRYTSFIDNIQPVEYTSSHLHINGTAETKEIPETAKDIKYSYGNNILNIEAKEKIKRITIYNLFGYKVIDKEINASNISVSVKEKMFILKIYYSSGKYKTYKIIY